MTDNLTANKNPKLYAVGFSVLAASLGAGFALTYCGEQPNHKKEEIKDFKTQELDEAEAAENLTPTPIVKDKQTIPVEKYKTKKTTKDKLSQDKTCPFNAHVVSVIDGDTFVADINLGLDVHLNQHVRINGINAPELHGRTKVAGQQSKVGLANIINDKDVCIKPATQEREKFGRILADVYVIVDSNTLSAEVGKQMIDLGFAKEYHGEKRE